MSKNSLVACHECDLLQRVPPVSVGSKAVCRRCGYVLHQSKRDSINRTLSLTIAGFALFVVANTFPFLAFDMKGQFTQTTLLTGVVSLYQQGMWGLSIVVLVTSVLVPLVQLLGLFYVLLPLKMNRAPYKLASVFRVIQHIQPWGMMEVFMLGILVSVVKLTAMASIIPGLAIWSFTLLIFVLAWATAALDPHVVWEKLDKHA